MNYNNIRPINDFELGRQIEALARGAALKSVSANEGMGYLSGAISEEDFDRRLEDLVMANTLQGLALGDVMPLYDRYEFDKKLERALSMPGPLSGLGFLKKLVKSAKKVVKKVGGAAKKAASKTVSAIKKVAPVALGAGALVFGGPAALAAAKSVGAGALAAAKAVGAKAVAAGKFVKGGLKKALPRTAAEVSKAADEARRSTAERLKKMQQELDKRLVRKIALPAQTNQPIESVVITDAATSVADDMLAREGINMHSPQAQEILAGYIKNEQNKAADAAGVSKSGGGGALLPLGIFALMAMA